MRSSGSAFSNRMRSTPSACAAQGERILVAGGTEADAEDADQGVELVGERHRRRDVVPGQRVVGEARLVVRLDGLRHRLRLAVVPGVVACP